MPEHARSERVDFLHAGTGHEVIRAHFHERRIAMMAVFLAVLAARSKVARIRKIDRAGNFALDNNTLGLVVGIRNRDCREQRLGACVANTVKLSVSVSTVISKIQ